MVSILLILYFLLYGFCLYFNLNLFVFFDLSLRALKGALALKGASLIFPRNGGLLLRAVAVLLMSSDTGVTPPAAHHMMSAGGSGLGEGSGEGSGEGAASNFPIIPQPQPLQPQPAGDELGPAVGQFLPNWWNPNPNGQLGEAEGGAAPEAVEAPAPVPVPQFRLDHQGEEEALFARISSLEAECAPGLPPQNNNGEYLSALRDTLTCSASEGEEEYLRVLSFEDFELGVYEKRARIMHMLKNLLLSEGDFDAIARNSSLSNTEEEASDFLSDQMRGVECSPEYEDARLHPGPDSIILQRTLMTDFLDSFITSLEREGINSPRYISFKEDFMR